MARITKERLALAREFVRQWHGLQVRQCDAVGWLMLKFSCPRPEASRLLDAVERDTQQASGAR